MAKRLLAGFLIELICFYQNVLSALIPASCRFTPSCSAYAIQAIEQRGILSGLGLAIWRILRCNPWGGCGYDPVPPKGARRGAHCCADDRVGDLSMERPE